MGRVRSTRGGEGFVGMVTRGEANQVEGARGQGERERSSRGDKGTRGQGTRVKLARGHGDKGTR